MRETGAEIADLTALRERSNARSGPLAFYVPGSCHTHQTNWVAALFSLRGGS